MVWYRWPTRLFAVVATIAALVTAVWASTVASEAERFIPPLAFGGVALFMWRAGFSPSVRQTASEVVIEQPWWTWHVPLISIVEVSQKDGTLSIKTATRDISAFGLSSSLLLSIFGDERLHEAVQALTAAASGDSAGLLELRVRVTVWRFLLEAIVIVSVFLGAAAAAQGLRSM
jgi:hypothetical protein